MRAVPSSWMDQPSVSTRLLHMHDLETRGLEHFLRGFFHVGGHLVLVVAELVVKTQRGNAPFVLHDGIEVHVIFVARQHFTEGTHADVGALVLAHFFLE